MRYSKHRGKRTGHVRVTLQDAFRCPNPGSQQLGSDKTRGCRKGLRRSAERTQTNGIPTSGVVDGAGEPPAGSSETANAARPRTPSISVVAAAWPAGSRPTEIGVVPSTTQSW